MHTFDFGFKFDIEVLPQGQVAMYDVDPGETTYIYHPDNLDSSFQELTGQSRIHVPMLEATSFTGGEKDDIYEVWRLIIGDSIKADALGADSVKFIFRQFPQRLPLKNGQSPGAFAIVGMLACKDPVLVADGTLNGKCP